MASLAAVGQAQSQSTADSLVAACIMKDTSTAWQREALEWSYERPGTWTNDSLRLVLIELADADQAVRPASGFVDSTSNQEYLRRMAAQDSVGLIELRHIIRKFGWPSRSLVGARGSAAAFLIAQHNESIHAEALRLMQSLPPGEVQTSAMAMLEDRLLALSGKPQKYATQLKPMVESAVEFYPIDSIARVDARRSAVGLPPISVYLCMMTAFTGRPIKYPP